MAHSIRSREDGLLEKINRLMQQAASRSDYKEVQRLARIAEELSLLEKKEQEITQSRARLERSVENPPERRIDSEEMTARERGNRVRHQYVEGILRDHGIQLKQLDSKKYQTTNGHLIGITYAKELANRPSFWFLGLSDESFDCVILLCESLDASGAEIAAFIFPTEFVKQIWKALSRSKGQVKFHVTRTAYMSFELHLPGARVFNISHFLNAVQSLN